MSNQGRELYEFGPFRLDPVKRVLLRDNQPVPLQLKSFETLLVLVRNSEQVVLKDDLMKAVWPDTFVEESNLAQNIFVLRKTLGATGGDRNYIVTIPGRGYRFADKVRVISEEENLFVASHSRSRVVIEEKSSRTALLSAGVIMIAALVGGGLYWRYHRTPKLTERDSIVIADFANSTGDPVFDGTLRQGLSAQLEQSPFLNLLSEQRTAQTLSLMAQPKDARLTHELAREVCQRTGSAALLAGSIAQVGTQYLLLLKAINCANDESLASAEAQAKDKNHVLDALGKLASEIRSSLGESLASVQKYDVPLEDVTTPSLDALKAYSLATAERQHDNATALPLLQRAISLDPNFAMAYARLGVVYFNLGESVRAIEALRKAYDLRGRVSEREKFNITASYDDLAVGNFEAARNDYELWEQIYPRDPAPVGGLSVVYVFLGQYDKVLEKTQEKINLSHIPLPDSNLAAAYIFLTRLDDANAAASQGIQVLHSPLFRVSMYNIDFLQRDLGGMEREMAQLAAMPGWEDQVFEIKSDTASYGGQFEKARDLTRLASDSAKRADKKQNAAEYQAEAAVREALVGNVALAKRQAKAALTLADGREVEGMAATALALSGNSTQAMPVANDLDKRYPENTIVHFKFLPMIRAAADIWSGNPAKAVEYLKPASLCELGLTSPSMDFTFYPVYLRGQAYLAAKQGSPAAAEFQKILEHPGVVTNEVIGSLAYLGLGRAYALMGNKSKAKLEYEDFLGLWKDADPDIPILKQAKAEYAKMQ